MCEKEIERERESALICRVNKDLMENVEVKCQGKLEKRGNELETRKDEKRV